MNRPASDAPDAADAAARGGPGALSQRLSGLSVGDLLAELSQVEDSLRGLPGRVAEADSATPESMRRRLRQREHAIVAELTARRHRRGLIAAPLVQERAPLRTPPPWA